MIQDCCVVVGIGLVVYAAHAVYPPLAPLVAGVALVVIGLGGVTLAATKKPEASTTDDR